MLLELLNDRETSAGLLVEDDRVRACEFVDHTADLVLCALVVPVHEEHRVRLGHVRLHLGSWPRLFQLHLVDRGVDVGNRPVNCGGEILRILLGLPRCAGPHPDRVGHVFEPASRRRVDAERLRQDGHHLGLPRIVGRPVASHVGRSRFGLQPT